MPMRLRLDLWILVDYCLTDRLVMASSYTTCAVSGTFRQAKPALPGTLPPYLGMPTYRGPLCIHSVHPFRRGDGCPPMNELEASIEAH